MNTQAHRSPKSKIAGMPCVMSYRLMARVLRAAVQVGWRMRGDVEVDVRSGAIEAPMDPADDRAPRIEINELVELVTRETEMA